MTEVTRAYIEGLIMGQAITSALFVRKSQLAVTPVFFTLEAGLWNGTTYTLNVSEYGRVGELVLGIPHTSSASNTERLIQSALTIARIEHETSSIDTNGDGETDTFVYSNTIITISAVTAPTQNVDVAIWGLIYE